MVDKYFNFCSVLVTILSQKNLWIQKKETEIYCLFHSETFKFTKLILCICKEEKFLKNSWYKERPNSILSKNIGIDFTFAYSCYISIEHSVSQNLQRFIFHVFLNFLYEIQCFQTSKMHINLEISNSLKNWHIKFNSLQNLKK